MGVEQYAVLAKMAEAGIGGHCFHEAKRDAAAATSGTAASLRVPDAPGVWFGEEPGSPIAAGLFLRLSDAEGILASSPKPGFKVQRQTKFGDRKPMPGSARL